MARRTIRDSRVVLTGASSGIGDALARELARRGARQVIVARRVDRLEALAAELRSAGAEVEIVAGDVADPAVRAQAIGRCAERFGGLDTLVNNAGIGALGRFDVAQPDRLRRIFEVNFFALVEMTRAALPHLKRGRDPIVVNVGSILGHRGIPGSVEYCASKFAVQGFSESLRAELVADGVDVLVVSPGTTETEFFRAVIEKQGEPKRSHRRGVSADAVARATARAIERGAHEIIPNFQGRLLCWLNRFSPRLADSLVARFG